MSWRRPVTRGALLLMESLWVYAVVAFFVSLVTRDGDRPTLVATFVVVAVSFSISRFLQASSLPLGLMRAYGVLLSIVVFYGIVRVDFYGDWRFWDFTFADDLFYRTEATLRDQAQAVVGVPLLWLFWLRGVMRGQEYLGFEAVLGSFATGIVVISVVELFAGAVAMPAAVSYLPIPFIGAGLLTIGLAHAARAEDEFGRSFAPTWLIAVGGAVVALAAFALVFIILDYGAVTGVLSDGALLVMKYFALAIYYASIPLFWVLERLFEGVRWLIENLYGGDRQQQPLMQEEPEPSEEEQAEPRELPQWAQLIVRVLVGGSLLTAMIAALALVFTRFRRREPPDGVKESTYQEGRLASDLGELLGSLLGRFRPGSRDRRADLDQARRLYFDLLDLGEERGVERRAPETPLELAPRLSRALGSQTPVPITRLFEDVRYGASPPPPGEAERLRQQLEQIRENSE